MFVQSVHGDHLQEHHRFQRCYSGRSANQQPVLLANNEEDLQAVVDRINEAGKEFNMKMNAKKTKTMIISKVPTANRITISVDGANIEQVSRFTYLGQTITEDGKCEGEIKKRVSIARTAFSKLSKVLTSRKIPLPTR